MSGIDTVAMEFQMLYARAKKDNRDKDSAMYVDILTLIRNLKEQTMKDLRS